MSAQVAIDELTCYQIDLLAAAKHVRDGGDLPSGQNIRAFVEARQGYESTHGRLYPNLDDLADRGLIRITAEGRRTNRYEITARGERILADRAAFLNGEENPA